MKVDIVVARVPADKQGPDIVSGLLSSESAARCRGLAAIEDSTSVQLVTLTVRYRHGVRCGQIVQVLDELQGAVWYGKIIGITHTARLADTFTELRIEKRI